MSFNTDGLLEPQKVHANRLADSLKVNGMSWDGSATGTGKTFSAMAIIRDYLTNNADGKFVIICPKLAIPQWKADLAKWGLKAEFLINYEKLARGNTPYYTFFKAPSGYRKLHKIEKDVEVPPFLCARFKLPKNWLVVLDESHKCKGVESLNAGMLFNLKRQGYKFHLMSATQATSPLDMRAFGFAMDLHSGDMKQYKNFCLTAGAELDWKAMHGALKFDSTNTENMAKLKTVVHDYLFDGKKVGSRLTRTDMGDIFPVSQVVCEAYDMGAASDKIQSVYDEMEMELDLLEERCASYKEHILAIITRARRHAELLKVPTMVNMVADYKAEGRSSVIFVNYTDTITALVERLGKEFNPELIGQIHGGQTFAQRQRDIVDFNADRKHFMVANLAAGGQCINLHDLNGDRARSSLINPSYSAISVLQSAGRIDRAYAKTDVYQRFLLAARTIEENVASRLNDRNGFINALNDGSLTDNMLIPSDRLYKFAHGMDV